MKRFIFCLITALFIFPACSSTKWVRTPVIKNADVIVTLEERQVEGEIVGQVYQHPFNIELSDLKRFLSDLTYIEKVGLMGREEKIPVFQAAEIERLAPALADTLTKAADSQRIRFTSYNRGKGLIFSVSRKTEGVLFIAPDGYLNIAFNFINSEINMNETTAFPDGFTHKDPLKTSFADTALVKTQPYAEPHLLDSGEPAPLWMVVDLQKLKAMDALTPAPVAGSAPEIAPPDDSKVQSPDTSLPASETTLRQEIRSRLIYLKELLDDGLITEQDYDAQKAQLLDKLN